MPTYAAADDLIKRFDERDIQQLVVDDSSDSTTVDVSSNARVETALDDAEGEVIAALRKGGRYEAAQLAALTGTSRTNRAAVENHPR
jgi:phage gp36-like protein